MSQEYEERLRKQLRAGHAEAFRALTRERYQLDPRIAEARKKEEMAIKILETADITLTESEARRYITEYQRAYTHYSGEPPSFEEFVRARQRQERQVIGALGLPTA